MAVAITALTLPGPLTPGVGAAPAQSTPKLPVTVDNADGGTTTVADVSRIVSLNGDITEVIFALGLGKSVVATDTSATYPAGAAALPKIGYQRTLNAEGILSFSPTVVIGNVDAGPPPVIQQLRDASVPVVILPIETTREAPIE
jgi:iron complex transport system substrate-binding protein